MSPAAAAVGAQVVVCEDDPPTLELLCDHLLADRYVALPAPTAADALRLCHFKAPDLLLLDLSLPDTSGLDVLREIRASERSTGRYDPSLPVIVLSGRVSEADRLRGFDEGADDYVPKPFSYLELAGTISGFQFQVFAAIFWPNGLRPERNLSSSGVQAARRIHADRQQPGAVAKATR